MKTIKIILLLIISGFVASAQQQEILPSANDSLTPSEFKQMLEYGELTLIDVRTPEEFNKERIAGAININVMTDDFEQKISALDRQTKYLLYCGIGKRSARAMNIMKKAGFEKVYTLEGGLTAWKKAGYDTIKK